MGHLIAVENSTWNNIGDAFYQCTVEKLFARWFPESVVVPIDGPPRRAFSLRGRQMRNVFDARFQQDADLFVFSGPILETWWTDYADLVKSIVMRGKSYGMISLSACNELPKAAVHKLNQFFDKYPPAFISTRDSPTYDYVKNLNVPTHDGVCAAWFASKIIPFAPATVNAPYITTSFHRLREPRLDADQSVNRPEDIRIKSPLRPATRFSRVWQLATRRDKSVGKWAIVRPQHGINLSLRLFQFPLPGSFASLTPYSYLSLYSSSSLTITDRVHAAVVSNTLGVPTRLVYDCFRCGLFDRMGVKFRNSRIMPEVSQGKLMAEMLSLENFIRSVAEISS